VCTCITYTTTNNNGVQSFMTQGNLNCTCARWCCVFFVCRPYSASSCYMTYTSVWTGSNYYYFGGVRTCNACQYGCSFTFYYMKFTNCFSSKVGTFGNGANNDILLP
jgi:hypothetical protein